MQKRTKSRSLDDSAEFPEIGSAASAVTEISPEQRHHYVQVAAYYIAQRRGFGEGDPAEDWAAAELEIDQRINAGHFLD